MSDTETVEAEETVEVPEVTVEMVRALFDATGEDRLQLQRQLGVVNPIMLAKALGVRPQMIYNYIRDGKIKTVDRNNTQKITIDVLEAERWAQTYLGRKAAKAAKIEAELRGES
jgi:hypothetical protein